MSHGAGGGGGYVSHPLQLTTGLVIDSSVTTSPTLAGERMLLIPKVSILSEQTVNISENWWHHQSIKLTVSALSIANHFSLSFLKQYMGHLNDNGLVKVGVRLELWLGLGCRPMPITYLISKAFTEEKTSQAARKITVFELKNKINTAYE